MESFEQGYDPVSDSDFFLTYILFLIFNFLFFKSLFI